MSYLLNTTLLSIQMVVCFSLLVMRFKISFNYWTLHQPDKFSPIQFKIWFTRHLVNGHVWYSNDLCPIAGWNLSAYEPLDLLVTRLNPLQVTIQLTDVSPVTECRLRSKGSLNLIKFIAINLLPLRST